MANNGVDQIFARLRATASQIYPERGICKAVRLVGHTPKSEYYTYEAVIEFAIGQERVACKVYRGKSGKDNPKQLAEREYENMVFVFEASQQHEIGGIPRPLGDFTEFHAVVMEKIPGLPLQSVIMKAALLPGSADLHTLRRSAALAGKWLSSMHKATSTGNYNLDTPKILHDLETVCNACKKEGLEESDVHAILNGAKQTLQKSKKSMPAATVFHCFAPLNISVTDDQVFLCDLSKVQKQDLPLRDVAHFLACVEALEKYPFCKREITSQIQDDFRMGYGLDAAELGIVRVLKMQALLKMFAAGRDGRQSAARKRVMWANVMKRFIQTAATRMVKAA